MCEICGDAVVRAEPERQAHLETHSFAEVLRFEIRQDLDLVPEGARAAIVRDIYRQLLGTGTSGGFELGAADGMGLYSIDEALGGLSMYQLWRSASHCGRAGCAHR
jgi:hypothetical protein